MDNCKVNCLLPEPFRKLGFIDHRKFISEVINLTHDEKNWILFEVDDLLFYGEVGIAILMADFFNEVLYNECYTTIVSTCKPQYIKEHYIHEIFEKADELKTKFDKLEEQLEPIFQSALSDSNGVHLHTNEKNFSCEKFIFFFNTQKVLFSNALFNLIKRLTISQKYSSLTKN